MVTITRLVQTCEACPSQWDGWDAEGNYYYFRYRHGHFCVRGPVSGSGLLSGPVFMESTPALSGGGDGFMTFEELRVVVEGVMQFELS